MIDINGRSESEVFNDLEYLCASPGYAHAIAFFFFKYSTIRYNENIKVENLQNSIQGRHRGEMFVLIGLAFKSLFDIQLPAPKVIQEYIDKTELLLDELHNAIWLPIVKSINFKKEENIGTILKEAIFYAPDSAYNFQYRDFFYEKYKNDNNWFIKNKGYSIDQAQKITQAIIQIQNKKLNNFIPSLKTINPDKWTVLPIYKFTINEICLHLNEDELIIKAFINSFVVSNDVNKRVFSAIDDFNPFKSYPIIKINEGEYILFHSYSLLEALYETPLHWLINDESYKRSGENRGDFTESFSEKRLKLVFGEKRVFSNIEIYRNKKSRMGEIDVLVTYGNRAIILEAKSKKLTNESRKGNLNKLKDDFMKAIQKAYDQVLDCSKYLLDESYKLIDGNGIELKISREYDEIYPICIISDHYPALNFQVRDFLNYKNDEKIKPPFVIDLFFLDVMTEFLQSPLYFLSYIKRRVNYIEKISAVNELAIFAFHLKQNLWFQENKSKHTINESYCSELDTSMMVRRDKIPGKDTPEGILTKYQNTLFGQIIEEIQKSDDPCLVDFGLLMLELDSITVEDLNNGISELIALEKKDAKPHDLSIIINDGSTGLTIYLNRSFDNILKQRLEHFCLIRKYSSKAKTWYGLSINTMKFKIDYCVSCNFEWKHSDKMDVLTKRFTDLNSM